MTEWEYRVIDAAKLGAIADIELRYNDDFRWLEDTDEGFVDYCIALDQLGENGWEVCGIDEPIGIAHPEFGEMAPNNGQWTRAWLFKRRKGSTQKWEYSWALSSYFESKAGINKHAWWTSEDADKIRKSLNDWGKDGWELCAVSSNGPTHTPKPHEDQNQKWTTVLIYYFKRPKKD